MIVKVWDGEMDKVCVCNKPKTHGKSIEEHMEILKAIKNRDEDTVERLVREHRINAGKELEKNYKKR